VQRTAPGFIQVYDNDTEMLEKGGSYLNVKYSQLRVERIR